MNVLKDACVLMKALSHETRLNMLLSLHNKPKTWTQLLFELEINPKSIRDHLACLKKVGFIQKAQPSGFELTEPARIFIDLSLEDLFSIVKLAMKEEEFDG